MQAKMLGGSAATYGVEVQGMYPSLFKLLRRSMVQVTRIWEGKRQCPVTALAIVEDVKGLGPVIEAPDRVVAHWAVQAFSGNNPDSVAAWWQGPRRRT